MMSLQLCSGRLFKGLTQYPGANYEYDGVPICSGSILFSRTRCLYMLPLLIIESCELSCPVLLIKLDPIQFRKNSNKKSNL